MDPRFKESDILKRRESEWNSSKIKQNLIDLFSNVSLVDGWKLVNVSWTKSLNPRIEELKKHLVSGICITISDNKDNVFKYDLKIPDLVNNQFFYIGGYYKIPLFQLFDYPIIYTEGKNFIRFHNNIMTINMDIKNGPDPTSPVHIFNRIIPLNEIVTCLYEESEFSSFMGTIPNPCGFIIDLYKSCKSIWDVVPKLDRTKAIGKLFSTVKNDEEKKGNSFIFSLKSAYEIDIFTKKFMKTDSIIFEILNAIQEGTRSDTDLNNKRIRFSEYLLAPLIRKLYDMILTIRNTTKNSNFKIPQNILIENCNVSEFENAKIVRFNLAVNPVGELASFMQCTLTGLGGLQKHNVPPHLRTIDDSQLGYICPADTPDRDGCGVLLNMNSSVDIDKDGKFRKPSESNVTSYPIALTPFLKNDDPTRLQMASNQIKQAILLEKSEIPMIKSGVEKAFLEKSTFLHRARSNGSVVYSNADLMIVIYDDDTGEVFKPYFRNDMVDYIQPLVKEGDFFKKDQILCQSKFIKNGELSLGSNLLTGIAIWKGFNYEDGIVISSSVLDKFCSIHTVDLSFEIEKHQVILSLLNDRYKPLPSVGDIIKNGDIYAKLKSINSDDNIEHINISPIEKVAPLDCKITSIEYYPNDWNKNILEYDLFIKKGIQRQSKRFNDIKNKITQYLGKTRAEKFISVNGLTRLDTLGREGKYYFQGKKINGVYVKIQAVYKEKISIGDKIANRHGNKGVCSIIIPEEKMPILPDGRRLDIICNPLGIIGRMNCGQLYELHLSECLYNLKKNMKSMTYEEAYKYLEKFLDITDKTSDSWGKKSTLLSFKNIHTKFGLIAAINRIELYQPPFESLGPEDLLKAIEFTGSKDKYKIHDPEENIDIENPIACGYLYFMKLVHRASEKMSARSIGPYSQKTLQPLGGRSNQGGHKLGEMEVWSLKAYGADGFLSDLLTIHSDSSGYKNRTLSDILKNPDLINEDNSEDNKPISLKLLEANLNSLGIEIER